MTPKDDLEQLQVISWIVTDDGSPDLEQLKEAFANAKVDFIQLKQKERELQCLRVEIVHQYVAAEEALEAYFELKDSEGDQ